MEQNNLFFKVNFQDDLAASKMSYFILDLILDLLIMGATYDNQSIVLSIGV